MRPNKKPESPYFTRDRLISYYYSSSSFSLYVKNINIYFFLFSSLLISFSSPPWSGMFSSSFFFYPLSFFLINILYRKKFLSLASLANYINVRFFFFLLFSWFFSLYIFFILFLIVFVLNNCINVVVIFFFHMRSIFSWFIYRIFKFLAIATSFFSY